MSLIRLEGVTKTVPLADDATLDILRGVDLVVEAGEHVSIVGRSGSGKSTLLNILGLIDAPTTGTHWFDEVDVSGMRSGARDRLRGEQVGFIFQQFNLLQGRTALENVMTPLLYSSGAEFWRRRSIAGEMLERVGLGHRADSMPHRLSGGEQQRVAIARSLVRRPRVILADEPTGALDVETGAGVMTLLDAIATENEAALVTITHDLAVATRASRHYQLDTGVLSASVDGALGTPTPTSSSPASTSSLRDEVDA